MGKKNLKLLLLLVTAVIALCLFAGCKKKAKKTEAPATTTTAAESVTQTTESVTETTESTATTEDSSKETVATTTETTTEPTTEAPTEASELIITVKENEILYQGKAVNIEELETALLSDFKEGKTVKLVDEKAIESVYSDVSALLSKLNIPFEK